MHQKRLAMTAAKETPTINEFVSQLMKQAFSNFHSWNSCFLPPKTNVQNISLENKISKSFKITIIYFPHPSHPNLGQNKSITGVEWKFQSDRLSHSTFLKSKLHI